MGVLSAAPTSPEDQYQQNIAALERRIADLERSKARDIGGLPMFSSRYAPFGAARVVGKASTAVASGTSANATPVATGLAVTVPCVIGRAYRIDSTHNLTMAAGAAPNYAQVLHYNGANVTLFQIKPGAVGVYLTQSVSSYFIAGATGNVTVTIFFMNPLGGTTVQDYADGTALRYLFVTEIG